MLKVFTWEQSETWDAIVHSFVDYDTYWLSGYVRAFHIHGDGEPLLLYAETDEARGINVVMLRDIAQDPHFAKMLPKGVYFDIASPYGYGGWLIEGGDISVLFAEYEAWARENGIISEFVRFHPVLKNHEPCCAFYDVLALGNTVTLDLASPEMIWANITSKNRNVIRKAQKMAS